MDVVTHAASGALLALALPRRPETRWCLPLFMLVACLPDFDILFGMSQGLFISVHRGLSHSIFLAPLLAFAAALVCRPLWRRSTPQRLPLGRAWLVFWLLLLMHIFLDCMTTYGTRIFSPFSDTRIRLNAVFIVDCFMTVPMLVLFVWGFFSRQLRRRLACAGLAWMVLYPCLCLGLNQVNTRWLEANLLQSGHQVSELVMLPDFFTPFYWRAVYQETLPDGCLAVCEQSLGGLGRLRGEPVIYASLPRELGLHLAAQSTKCRDFLKLMLVPVISPLPARAESAARVALSILPDRGWQEDAAEEGEPLVHEEPCGNLTGELRKKGLKFLLLSDLRFSSGLVLGREILAMRPKANVPFMLMLVLDHDYNVLLERIVLSDLRKDSGWERPSPPEPQSFGQWLLGLY